MPRFLKGIGWRLSLLQIISVTCCLTKPWLTPKVPLRFCIIAALITDLFAFLVVLAFPC
uniref:Uncharacterized protein n=1 Tax=Brassica oleracea var. oleracea TaxID=109376 RepID=A0A0D2ZVM1_BRAOL